MRKKLEKMEQAVASASMSQAGLIWYRFKKNKLAVFGLIVLSVLALVCFASPLYIDYQTVIQQNTSQQFISPGADGHIFGTDMYGRDLFARIMYGGMVSLSCGFAVLLIALILALFFGSVSGYFGGRVDFFVMRFIDIMMCVPYLLLAMALIMAMGQSTWSLLLAIGVAMFPGLTRLVRASIMTVRDSEYVDAAKCYGSPVWKILIKHIIPNGIGPVVVSATLMLGGIIPAIAGFGFLGIGVAPPTPEWGTILSEARDYIRYYPYLGIIPGVAIGTSVLCINFVGDGIRDALDPRTKK